MTLHLGAAIAHISSIRCDVAQRTGCPEWDNGGIRAALIATDGAPADVSAAACLAAGDPKLDYPSARGFAMHWPKNASAPPRVSHDVPCVDHPGQVMPCPTCKAADHMTPDEIAAAAALVKAEIAATRHDTAANKRQEAQQ